MAYIKETISSNGDRTDFAQALRDFFLNNAVAPFELVSEDYTTDSNKPTVELERNNLKIKIVVGYSASQTQIAVFSKTADGTYFEQKGSTSYSFSHSAGDTSNSALYRAAQLCLIKSEETIMMLVAPYNADKFYKGLITVDTQLTGGENLIANSSYSANGTTLQFKEVTSQLAYTPRQFHTGSPDEATLILSNQLAVNGNNGVYCGEAIGLKSAGGAKQFTTYVTDSGTYLGVLADVVILLGDKAEYASGVSL